MTEAPFREFYEASLDAIVVVDGTGRIQFANNRVEALLGYSSDELLGQSHNILVPERYRDRHLGHMDRYMVDPSPRMMGAGLELTALCKDGSELLVEISLTPYQAAAGLAVIAALRDITTKDAKRNVLETENSDLRSLLVQAKTDAAVLVAQAGIDATENEAAKRLQRLLLEEVHHRMKNMLAMIMAIIAQSLRTADNIEQGELAIASRLAAFGRAQNLLLDANEARARLDNVVGAAIEPFASGERKRFFVSGLPIEIASGAVLPLTLSLNELCTNAVKYGALSNATGRVEIVMTADEQTQVFTLRWAESGGPVVVEPPRQGFGTRLLGALASQLHGEVRLQYEPAGVVYQLNIPLALL